MRGRPRKPLVLTAADVRVLRALRRGLRSAAPELNAGDRLVVAPRARIILALRRGGTNAYVAKRLRVSSATVGKWRNRFIKHGVAGLLEGRTPRSGMRMSKDVRNAVRSRVAQGQSTREIAHAINVSQSTVARLLRTATQATLVYDARGTEGR